MIREPDAYALIHPVPIITIQTGIASRLPIEYNESNIGATIVLSGACLCPCGEMEVITTACRGYDNYRRLVALHHGWHHACFAKGYDVETKMKIPKLEAAADRIRFT